MMFESIDEIWAQPMRQWFVYILSRIVDNIINLKIYHQIPRKSILTYVLH